MFTSKKEKMFNEMFTKLENKLDIIINKTCQCNEIQFILSKFENNDDKLNSEIKNIQQKQAGMESMLIEEIKPKNEFQDLLNEILSTLHTVQHKLSQKTLKENEKSPEPDYEIILKEIKKLMTPLQNKDSFTTEDRTLLRTTQTDIMYIKGQFNSNHQAIIKSIVDLNIINSKMDKSLRTDLQEFLIGLQKNIFINLKEYNDNSNDNSNLKDTLLSIIKDIIDPIKIDISLLNENVNGFYYENEIIKHQLQLEDDLRYYDENIQNIKEILLKTKENVDSTINFLSNKK